MNRGRKSRSDIVIGMTLAEVFLLLLIVGWYGSRLESEEKGGSGGTPATVPKADFDAISHERDTLKHELADQRGKYEQLTIILDWIAKTAGMAKPIRTLDEAKQAIKNIQFEAKRGRPACEATNNVLVDVTADSGRVVVTVRQDFPPRTHQKIAASGRRLSSDVDVAGFLAEVDSFYRARRSQSNSNCVFDYTLAWRTDADYRSARELFERHFYPARLRQLQ